MPRLSVDLAKITANTRMVAGLLEPLGVRLVAVTKGCCGSGRVAGAMLTGGAVALADSRVGSIAALRDDFPAARLQLMRCVPAGLSLPQQPDLFFVSSADQARMLLEHEANRPLRACLIVDTGDGREGVPVGMAVAEAGALQSLPGLVLAGVATNAACARPDAELEAALNAFAQVRRAMVEAVPAAEKRDFIYSAGGSGLLRLLLDGRGDGCPAGGVAGSHGAGSDGGVAGSRAARLFSGVTELRAGEAILLGRVPSAAPDLFLPGAATDAFVLSAPVLEAYEKEGRLQVLAGLGVQDIGRGTLSYLPARSQSAPPSPKLTPRKITSDYLLLDCAGAAPAVGERLDFIPDYYALLAAMTSPLVEKRFLD